RRHRYQSAADMRGALEAVKRARESTASRQAAPADVRPSIAVLPFANMSADKENEYFSDGLAEEIINVLAHVPGMKVAGRTSSFFFRGKDVEFGEIGRRLNVEHILEGECSQGGQPDPGDGAAHQGRRWFSSLVGALRPRDDGHLRDPG